MTFQKTYGYARVSTISQNEDRQVVALIQAGVPRKNIFIDKITGNTFDRPQYQAMLENLTEGSLLIIKSIDRLGRSYNDLGEQWRIITKEKKTDIYVIDMPILDTRQQKNLLGTFINDLILSLLNFCAAQEYNIIHERQREGIAAAKARGVRFGRPPIELPDNFDHYYSLWKSGNISCRKAAAMCNMAESSFRNKIKAKYITETKP